MVNHPAAKKIEHFFKIKNRDLFYKIKKFNLLNQHFLKHLDVSIRPYCYAVEINENQLKIVTANSAIAMQLRFQAPDLIRQLKQDPLFKQVKEIVCKVHPSLDRELPTDPQKKMHPLSKETAEIIDQIADTIKDQHLKEIMKKIAMHKEDQASTKIGRT